MIYADWRAFVNAMRAIRSSPSRATLWLVFMAAIGFFVWARTIGGSHAALAPLSDLFRADEIVSGLAAVLLATFATGKTSFGIFRSRAEARFIISSNIRPAAAVAYLIARDALLYAGRFALSASYVLFISIPRSVGALAFVLDLLMVLTFMIALTIAMVPRRLVDGIRAIACAGFGYALAVLAALPAARDLLDQFAPASAAAQFMRAHVPAWHPGALLLAPNVGWLLVTLALAAISIGVLVAMTRDAYPELYELSTAQIDLREKLGGKRGIVARLEAARSFRAAKVTNAVSTTGAPPGILVFVWRSFIEYRRQTTLRRIILDIVFWTAAGFGLARLAQSQGGVLIGALVGTLVNLLVIFSTTASGALALEMRRSIFWLSSAWLAERFIGIALARVWLQVTRAWLCALGVALGGGPSAIVASVAIGFPALFVLMTGTGFAAFALFPASIDQRGPLAILRILVTYVLLAPPLVFFGVLALALHLPTIGLAGFALLAVLESIGLIGFAAWRLDGRIDRLAAA